MVVADWCGVVAAGVAVQIAVAVADVVVGVSNLRQGSIVVCVVPSM